MLCKCTSAVASRLHTTPAHRTITVMSTTACTISDMNTLGNILWLVLGGLALAVAWAIVGIPLGIQAFKMAGLTLTPFGKSVVYGGGVGSFLANIIWVVLVGIWMAIGYLIAGVLNCITVIGVPFGIQSFKMAKLALWPFGAQVV